MADKFASVTDYPGRKGVSKPTMKTTMPGGEVNTKGFVHRQDLGPGKESTPSMPGTKRPVTKIG